MNNGFFSAGRKTFFFRARAFRNIHLLLVGCTLRVQIVCLLFFKKHFRISEKNAFTDCFDLSNVSHCRMSNSHMFFRLYDFPQLNRHKITINLHIFDAYLGSPWNHRTHSFMEYIYPRYAAHVGFTHHHILGSVSLVPGICAFNFPKTTVDRMVAAAKVSAAEALDEGRYFSTDDVLSVTRCCLLGVEQHWGFNTYG